jgi:hypothetical protein
MEFTKKLLQNKWKRDDLYPESFFGDPILTDQIHACVVVFDSVGMVFESIKDYELRNGKRKTL